MTGYWTERLDAIKRAQQQRPAPRPVHAPEPQPPEDPGIDGLVSQAKAEIKQLPQAATSFEERYGQHAGQGDIGILSRKPGRPQEEAPESLLDLSPAERAALINLGTRQGRFGPESQRAADAQDDAALVQQLVKDGVFNNTVDTTPRKAATTRGVAGNTQGNLGVR